MPPPNKLNGRRPSVNGRAPAKPAPDEIEELNTGDVMPLLDDELVEILDDDAPRKASPMVPSMRPASEKPKSRPMAAENASPTRRPRAEASEPEETAVMQSLAAREGAVAEAGFSSAFLYVEKGPGAGQLVPVLQGEMGVGRSSDSGLQLNHPSISRKHATLVRKGEQYFLQDLGSQNGTYVNWARIRSEAEIFPGDQISVGSAVLVLRGGIYNSAQRRPGVSPSAGGKAEGNRKVMIGAGLLAAVGLGALCTVGVVKMLGKPDHPAERTSERTTERADRGSDRGSDRADRGSERADRAEKADKLAAADSPKLPVAAKDPDAEVGMPTPPRDAPTTVAAAAKEEGQSPSRPIAPPPPEDPKPVQQAAAPKPVQHAAPAPVRVASAAPAKVEEAPQAVLKIYETGDVAGAVAVAQSMGANALAAKMQKFQSTYDAGKQGLANKDGGAAITNLDAALKLDESIASGWGKNNTEIRSQLGGLFLLAGNQQQARGNDAAALDAFKKAQGYQPGNAEVRKKIAELSGGGATAAATPAAKPAPTPTPKPTAKPKPAAKPASSKDAADAAFDG
jgi:hypothetical protein